VNSGDGHLPTPPIDAEGRGKVLAHGRLWVRQRRFVCGAGSVFIQDHHRRYRVLLWRGIIFPLEGVVKPFPQGFRIGREQGPPKFIHARGMKQLSDAHVADHRPNHIDDPGQTRRQHSMADAGDGYPFPGSVPVMARRPDFDSLDGKRRQ